ncbi:hypothetical protein ACHAXR_007866 [Thalassiosira sp. AJA248-18]
MRKPALSVLSALLALFGLMLTVTSSYVISPPPPFAPSRTSNIPPISLSTGLQNELYEWRGQRIRYVVSGPTNAKKSVLLIHGLFVNADHWRRTICELGNAGYRTYAIDLLGSGYSSKPRPDSAEANLLNGENGRFITTENDHFVDYRRNKKQQLPIRSNVVLGTASGGRRVAKELDLRHPLKSCYNFYTWAEQISDFTRDVILTKQNGTASLVANSKGTIAALQAVLDTPQYFNGVCALDPTYREMHHAEMRFPAITMPIVKLFQKFLRRKGKGLYNIATQRACIKTMLKEPYNNVDAIDDELVTSLMEPLNLPNAAETVFDELSYTTGPLFEQLLQDINDTPSSAKKPIWVCYGEKDPWLSPKRVESLITTPFTEVNGAPVVDKVVAIANAGHCPHDERPEMTNPIILEFLGHANNCKTLHATKHQEKVACAR